MVMRDPLVLAYEALASAIKSVHGEDIPVLDDLPDATEFRKKLPAANISYVSGSYEKALMREFVPHKIERNEDRNKFTVVTETARFDYLIQVSFFAEKKGKAQSLSNAFYTAMEIENEILLPDDPWEEKMQIFMESPPLPPRGEPDLYQCDQVWRCRGKLLTTEVVNKIDLRGFIPRIGNELPRK